MLLHCFQRAFQAPELEMDDEDMLEQTGEQRYRRFRGAEQCEVSSPDEWADVYYGPVGEEAPTGEMLEEF